MPDSQKVVRYGRDHLILHEDPADEQIRAGDLVERTSTGVQLQSTDAEQLAQVFVALDARQRGMELDDSYPADDSVKYAEAVAGGLHLQLAAGENVSEDTELVANGNGAVRAFDSANDTRDAIIAVTTEAVDNSGGSDRTPIATEVANA